MLEDVGKKLTVFGRQMMKKTGEAAEIASLHTKVMTRKRKAQKEIAHLGRLYYEAHKDEISEFESNITTINNLYREISEMEEELRAVKERTAQEDIFEDEENFETDDVFEEDADADLAEEPSVEEAAEEETQPEEASAEEAQEEEAAAEGPAQMEEAAAEEPTQEEEA